MNVMKGGVWSKTAHNGCFSLLCSSLSPVVLNPIPGPPTFVFLGSFPLFLVVHYQSLQPGTQDRQPGIFPKVMVADSCDEKGPWPSVFGVHTSSGAWICISLWTVRLSQHSPMETKMEPQSGLCHTERWLRSGPDLTRHPKTSD